MEFRLVNKDTIDTILRKFLTSRRMPPYMELSDAEAQAEYAKEPNKQCYLSSAYFKDHWSYTKTVDTFKLMLDENKSDFVCGFPYELSLQEGLLFKDDIEGEMLESDFNEIKWSMELEALFYGDDGTSFFEYNTVAKNRAIKYPMLPARLSSKIQGKAMDIRPKVTGEKRILSADIALMSSKKNKNDASAIFINQLLPTKSRRYSNNIIYGETMEGLHTEDQALIIRKLYDEFLCDYIVIDASGVGLGVFDVLVREIVDRETGEIYPGLSCCNNPEMASRCTTPNAEKAIWAIKGNESFNSMCAILLREGFRSGKIRLLINEFDGEDALSDLKGYGNLNPPEKVALQMPYIETTLLINELVQLQHDNKDGKIKVYEKNNMRKDRYSSLSYSYYVADELERRYLKKNNSDIDINTIFTFRPPKNILTGRKQLSNTRRW